MASERVMRSFAVWALFASAVLALPIEVGIGQNDADVYIEWSDGFIAEFVVKFDTETITGLGLFDVIEAETTLTTVRENYGYGVFIDGISYEEHSDIGFGGGENWWHYWIKDAGQDWVFPAFGVSDRTLYGGDSDGWVYGRAGEPVPEPATVVLLAFGAAVFRRKTVGN